MICITLQNLSKHFAQTRAVDDVSLAIAPGQLFFLLGPSGCGKTTLLRMIAGFVLPTAGRILFDDRDLTFVPPHQRDTGMVFQSYALWPHLSVAENVAFGLDVRRIRNPERQQRLTAALELVQMAHLADRRPNQLSGGQQQRVALARAIAICPRCLLLDEPLSNLDAKLRLEMRSEIRRIVKQTGITAVYVTHDQKEALSMADRIAVLRAGKLEQTGTPDDLYRRPNSRFVADFIGESNFIPGSVQTISSNVITVQTAVGPIQAKANGTSWEVGQKVLAAFRPEAVSPVMELIRTGSGGAGGGGVVNILQGRRIALTYLGELAEHTVELANGQKVKAFQLNPPFGQEVNTTVTLSIDPEHVMLVADA